MYDSAAKKQNGARRQAPFALFRNGPSRIEPLPCTLRVMQDDTKVEIRHRFLGETNQPPLFIGVELGHDVDGTAETELSLVPREAEVEEQAQRPPAHSFERKA